MAGDGKRVELVDDAEPSSSIVAYIGIGLIASVVVGFAPLSDAVKGNGTFESAMTRFLACFAVCVVAGAVIGRLLDGAPPAGSEDDEALADGEDEGTGRAGESGGDESGAGAAGDTADSTDASSP